ncbi:MAG: hypothetical protein HC877_15605 [Thioploca sp.]|nr:hypothetical protein [Thioploca sp.]
MKKSIFQENRKYTFSDYFEMNYPTDEIVGEFGYSYEIKVIDLPKLTDYDKNVINRLQDVYYTVFPRISLNSAIAKREFLVAPLLLEIVRNSPAKINIEYLLTIDDKLGGYLDYFVRADQELIVIAAEKKDIDNGFNQLAAELIALDTYEDNACLEILYGAVTLGDIWKFGTLDRKRQHIVKNIHSHTIPEQTEDVFSILMGIITN